MCIGFTKTLCLCFPDYGFMPKQRVMPIEKQFEIINQMIRDANLQLDDQSLPTIHGKEDYWGDYLDETCTLEENTHQLQAHFPVLKFDQWRRQPKRKLRRWLDENRRTGPDGRDYSAYTVVNIKRHGVISKGKAYVRGRIQITVDGELIGKRAEVTIHVSEADLPPLPPPPPEKKRRKRSKHRYYEL